MIPRLTPADLAHYFSRIGFAAPARPDLTTLVGVHRAHLLAIPYENLDIHFGRRLTLEPDDAYRRLVVEQRGGWCYEMNGLLGRVLATLGFDVAYVRGAVGREARGESVQGNHCVLLVTLGKDRWIADVGLGDGFLEPIPLQPGEYRQGGFLTRVELLSSATVDSEEMWRGRPHELSSVSSFDFTTTPRSLADFSLKCDELQTSPESGFVKSTVCQRFVPGGIVTLRGAVYSHVTPGSTTRRTITDLSDYARVLREAFGIIDPAIPSLWPGVLERHQAWLASESQLRSQA